MRPQDGPSRETLVAQIEALKALVERQRSTIGSMRASYFWKLRDAFFSFRRRFAGGIEPLGQPTSADLALEAGAFGDSYQLFRIRERRSIAELDSLRGLARMLAFRDPIEVIVDARGAAPGDLEATLASLRDQVYPFWRERVVVESADLHAFDPLVSVCSIEAGDVLEPDALLLVAIELNGGADLVYTDEDQLGIDGIPRDPKFKPGWSPETALSHDYVGGLCAIRGAVLAAAGGLDPAHGAAMWYDAALRVTESSDRVAHVARVLLHRRAGHAVTPLAAVEGAVRRALARRGESAEVKSTSLGVDVRFTAPDDERITVLIPTRDRADLLGRCLESLFERTLHGSFDVIVIDNGSREQATRDLLARWSGREPGRFRVIEDPAPFNYSRLNNRAAGETDAPFVLLLNNDTEVIEPAWMTLMLGQARRAQIGAVGALLLYEDGTVQHAGVVLGEAGTISEHVYRYLNPKDDAANRNLFLDTTYLAVTGACLLVARSKYAQVGGLDEALGVTYNDIDFCLKLRAAGYRNVVVPQARLLHGEAKSRGRDDNQRKAAQTDEERRIFSQRWPEWSRRDPYRNPNL